MGMIDEYLENFPSRRIPEDTGWVLDGFPATYNQAKLLEKALSGIDPDGKDRSKSKQRMSTLAPDPRPEQPTPDPPSGINVVILMDIDDELCLKRSAGRSRKEQFVKLILGLVQDCSISSVLAMEMLQFWTKPSIHALYQPLNVPSI